MLKPKFNAIILPAILMAFLQPAAQAGAMSSEYVCSYDRMVLCAPMSDSEGNPCEAEHDAFSIVAVAVGTGSMAFQVDDAAGQGYARGTGNMMGFGMHFEYGQASYALNGDVENPAALVVRMSDGRPVTAESWTGSCTLQKVDIDMIEKGASQAP